MKYAKYRTNLWRNSGAQLYFRKKRRGIQIKNFYKKDASGYMTVMVRKCGTVETPENMLSFSFARS